MHHSRVESCNINLLVSQLKIAVDVFECGCLSVAGRTCFRDEAPDLAPGLGRHVNPKVMSAVYLRGRNKPTFKPNAIKEPTS
jgi:hypothetical protein